ncbi:MAG: Nif3-like dinuclear metal center hexameric protein [Chitinophagaceae bacterium]|nr:Nif3-like dinuclear metal center hexameric protein [Chitinophagaceae bacterium]
MTINDVTRYLEQIAHPSLQEGYDNAGLITGEGGLPCTGILCTLDATEEVIREAMARNCNLVVAHHPIVFGGLKKLNGKNYVEKAVITAIRNDIAIYAIHTNLDHVAHGVNGQIAAKLGLVSTRVLHPKEQTLKKLYSFVPLEQADQVRNAVFAAGAGQIGQYSDCSFNVAGTGTYTPGEGTNPFAGQPGSPHTEPEIKIEMVFPAWLEKQVVDALKTAHPYEEVAYDVVTLNNTHPGIGAGLIGEFPEALEEKAFLDHIRTVFAVPVVRHTALRGIPVKKLAICGGAGSFLISKALASGADAFITADLKYHEFFDANGRLLLCDVGHYESEHYTTDLLAEVLRQKFPTFAVLKTEVKTNPVHYHQ